MVWLSFIMNLAFAADVAIEHQLVQKVVVFPVFAPPELKTQSEDTWWQIRDDLTQSRRFFVASKQFLSRRDSYQAREKLEPSDAIILGKLLDAHALIVTALRDRTVSMTAFDGQNGFVLWTQSIELHPSVPIKDQLAPIARKLIRDWVAALPYQGHTVVDPLLGSAVYLDRDNRMAKVEIGADTRLQVGDKAQWVRVISQTVSPVFQGGANIRVVAEGVIEKIELTRASVRIERAAPEARIQEYSLVRFPSEMEWLDREYAIAKGVRPGVTTEVVLPERDPVAQSREESKPLVSTLSIVGSIVGFLLLAL